MKPSSKMLVVALVADFAGLLAGAGGALYFGNLFLSTTTYSRIGADVTLNLFVLEKLQAGDAARAAAFLDKNLAADALVLGHLRAEMPHSQQVLADRLLKRVEEYRERRTEQLHGSGQQKDQTDK